jgi:hypothetical protein
MPKLGVYSERLGGTGTKEILEQLDDLQSQIDNISGGGLQPSDLANLAVAISTTENISASQFFGDGSQLTGIDTNVISVVDVTADISPTTEQTLTTFSVSVSGNIEVTLPAVDGDDIGLFYTFSKGSGEINILVDSGDTIEIEELVATYGLKNTTGDLDCITIQLVSATRWRVISYTGTWAEANMPLLTATGGNITYAEIDSVPHKIHTFTSDDDFEVTALGLDNEVRFLAVGGGGGGGQGAGGAGRFIDTTYEVSISAYPVVIGTGGAGQNNNGQGSDGTSTTVFGSTLIGGGGGGAHANDSTTTGRNGGSGGGGGSYYAGDWKSGGTASGIANSYGNNGGRGVSAIDGGQAVYFGGGGGGAGAAGSDPIVGTGGAHGGIGRQSDITGTLTYYAGGGGGMVSSNAATVMTRGLGGAGGGGDGNLYYAGIDPALSATAGEDGTGGGGGSLGVVSGGKGIVIIAYPHPAP